MKKSLLLSALLLIATTGICILLINELLVQQTRLSVVKKTAGGLGISSDNSSDPAALRAIAEKERRFPRLLELSQKLASFHTQAAESEDLEKEEIEKRTLQYATVSFQVFALSKEDLKIMTRIAAQDESLDDQTRLELLEFYLLAHSLQDSKSAADDAIQIIQPMGLDQAVADEMIELIVSEHVKRDPFNAYPWLSYLKDQVPFSLEGIKSKLIVSAAEKDPAAALDIAELEDLSGRSDPFHTFGFGLTTDNAERFFKAVREAKLTKRQLSALGGSISRGSFMHNFKDAKKALSSESITPDDRKLFCQAALINRLECQDDEITNWLSYFLSQPDLDGFNQVELITMIIPGLITRNYLALGEWISKQPESSHQSDWKRIYFETVSPHDLRIAEKYGVSE